MKRTKRIHIGLLIGLFLFLTPSFQTTADEKKLSKVLNVYNWEEYFGETTIADFEKKFGVKVNLRIFEEEEELISEVQSHPYRHDVIVCSDDSIRELKAMKLLSKINLKNIPNIKNLNPKYKNPSYDPNLDYSIPYMWGTTGIVVNRKFVDATSKSSSLLWDPKIKGRVAMLNNPEEVIGLALKRLGYSINSDNVNERKEAMDLLLKQKPLLTGYLDIIDIRNKMISEEIWIAQIYSGEGMFAMDKNENLEYFIPKEGSAMWIDNLAIPRDAEHKETAEAFINFVLDPIVSSKIANYLWYANCNIAAAPYTNKEILEDPSLYPKEETLLECEFFLKGGEINHEGYENINNEIWSKLHAPSTK